MKKVIAIITLLFFSLLLFFPVNAKSGRNNDPVEVSDYIEKKTNDNLVKKMRYMRNVDGSTTTEEIDSWIDSISVDSSVSLMLENNRDVFGSDGRTVVSNTSILPYSAIVCLEIKFPGSLGYGRGTGFLISDNILLTAGHCLYRQDVGWAEDVIIIPGRNGLINFPFGTSSNGTMRVSDEWYESSLSEEDWGLFEFDNTFSSNPGYLQIGYTADTITPFQGKISGYPTYVSGSIFKQYKQYEMDGTINYLSQHLFAFTIDASNGQSGAPIINTNGVAVGIYTGGSEQLSCNIGTRIDIALYYLITDNFLS